MSFKKNTDKKLNNDVDDKEKETQDKDNKISLELEAKKAKRYKIIRIIVNSTIIALFIGLIIFITIKYYPVFSNITKDEAARKEFIDKLDSYGWATSFIIIGLQIFQVIFMIIPSGPIVMAAGVLLNPVWAIFACLIGQTIGGAIIYLLIKAFGNHFVAIFTDPNKIKNSKLFNNENKTEVLMFGYLLIPVLPKDIVGFIAPFTKVGIVKYSLINFVARIPMTIVTVLLGSSIINIFDVFSGKASLDAKTIVALSLAALSALLALLCFIFNKRIIEFLDKRSKKDEE